MLIEINFRILNLLARQVVLTPKCFRSAYLNKGPGEAAEMFTNTALRKYWFILSANRQLSTEASKSALSSYSPPDTRGAAHHPRDSGSLALPTATMPENQMASSTQHSALTSARVHLQLPVDVGLVH